jgi:RNA polymerase sigma-70 factor (subfamily 1)
MIQNSVVSTDGSQPEFIWEDKITAARNGCDESLAMIVQRLGDYLLLVARGRIGDQVKSKFSGSDVVQMSLIDARKSINNFGGSTEEEIRAWMKEIVLNNLFDQSKRYTQTKCRAIKRERSIEQSELTLPDAICETPSVMLRRKESDSQLRRLVDRLPNQQRRVVQARHRYGYSNAEIASQLGITESAVRSAYSAGIEALRGWLSAEESE